MTDIVELLRSRRAFGLFGSRWMELTDPDHDCQEAADEIERLRAKIAYLEEVVKAQSSHMHPDASGSYSGTGSPY